MRSVTAPHVYLLASCRYRASCRHAAVRAESGYAIMTTQSLRAGLKDPTGAKVRPVFCMCSCGPAEQKHLFYCENVSDKNQRTKRLSQGETATVSGHGRSSHWNHTSHAQGIHPTKVLTSVACQPTARLVRCHIELLVCDYKRHNHPPAAATLKIRVRDA